MSEDELEEYLGNFGKPRPFTPAELTQAHTRMARTYALGQQLWGKTAEDLEQQLLRSRPRIPPGFELESFQQLLQFTQQMADISPTDPRYAWAQRSLPHSQGISASSQQLAGWEARAELVRRAIEYLREL